MSNVPKMLFNSIKNRFSRSDLTFWRLWVYLSSRMVVIYLLSTGVLAVSGLLGGVKHIYGFLVELF
jgi:hypothetical protein